MNMNKNISLLKPVEGANVNTLLGLTSLRLYRSSEEGMVSVTMQLIDPVRQYPLAGTRLTHGQIIELHNDLTSYLAEVGKIDRTNAVEDAHREGYEVGYEIGYEIGHSEGYESGYDVGDADGYDNGFHIGHGVGYGEGCDAQQEGWDEAYDLGHRHGIAAMEEGA